MQAGSSCIGKWRVVRVLDAGRELLLGKWRVVRVLDAGRELLYRKVASRKSVGCRQGVAV
jgi:hypothetical protein